MIFSKENKSKFKAVVKQTLPNILAIIFFSLQLSNLSQDTSQNYNSFEDLASQEITLDNDDDEKEDCFVSLSFDFEFRPDDTYETAQLVTTTHSSIQKHSDLTRAPPQV